MYRGHIRRVHIVLITACTYVRLFMYVRCKTNNIIEFERLSSDASVCICIGTAPRVIHALIGGQNY